VDVCVRLRHVTGVYLPDVDYVTEVMLPHLLAIKHSP